VRATLHPKYAADLKKCSNCSNTENIEEEVPKSVFIKIMPEHTGHSPEEDTMVNMVTLDNRVKDFIQERAKDAMLPISCIANNLRSFTDKLVSELNVDKDNRKFYPTE